MNKCKIVFAAFLAAALSASLLCGCNGGKDSSSDTQQAVTQSADSSNINILGFETLEFNADETEQSVNFFNPDNNACYFRLSLIIDGETLWTGDYLAPDESISEIELSKALDKGTYNAVLKYECFTLDNKTPLNGAEINVTINVK